MCDSISRSRRHRTRTADMSRVRALTCGPCQHPPRRAARPAQSHVVSPTHLAEKLRAADLADDVESGYGDGAPASDPGCIQSSVETARRRLPVVSPGRRLGHHVAVQREQARAGPAPAAQPATRQASPSPRECDACPRCRPVRVAGSDPAGPAGGIRDRPRCQRLEKRPAWARICSGSSTGGRSTAY